MVGERALKASEALRDIEGTTSLEEATGCRPTDLGRRVLALPYSWLILSLGSG